MCGYPGAQMMSHADSETAITDHDRTIVTRWVMAGWVLNSLLVAAGVAIMFISDVSPWIVGSVIVVALVLLTVGRWVALRRALGRTSPPAR